MLVFMNYVLVEIMILFIYNYEGTFYIQFKYFGEEIAVALIKRFLNSSKAKIKLVKC